jgi:hypothetical protein
MFDVFGWRKSLIRSEAKVLAVSKPWKPMFC